MKHEFHCRKNTNATWKHLLSFIALFEIKVFCALISIRGIYWRLAVYSNSECSIPSHSDLIFTLVRLNWKSLAGFLFLEITCPALNEVTNADVTVEYENDFVHSPPYFNGDALIYKCADGYVARGRTTLICGENGQWSHAQPKCVGKWSRSW